MGEQADGWPEQVHPASTVHVAEHPSPPNASPSSHASDPATMPSPQVVVHDEGSPEQDQPGST